MCGSFILGKKTWFSISFSSYLGPLKSIALSLKKSNFKNSQKVPFNKPKCKTNETKQMQIITFKYVDKS